MAMIQEECSPHVAAMDTSAEGCDRLFFLTGSTNYLTDLSTTSVMNFDESILLQRTEEDKVHVLIKLIPFYYIFNFIFC